MKISTKKALELLKQIRPDVELAETDNEDETVDVQIILDEYITSKEPVFKQKLTPIIASELAGQIGGKLKSTVKKLSGGALKEADLKDLTDEQVVEKFAAHFQAASSQDVVSLQNQLTQLSQTHQTELDSLKTTHTTELAAERQKASSAQISSAIRAMHNKFPLLAGGDTEKRSAAFKTYLESQYDLVTKDDKIELRKKGSPDLVLEGSKVVTPEDVAKSYYTDLGVWQTDMRNQGGKGAATTEPIRLPDNASDHDKDMAKAFAALDEVLK
ncbi:MAG: hypothetical protein ACEQSR_03715 [Candidatus Methylacidiphilales bacterium]